MSDKALRFDSDKVRHDLVSPNAINELAKVLTFGAQKYAPNNWMKGMKWSRVLGSLKRHLNAIERGEDTDPETGLLHAAHVMCNVMFLIDYYKIYPEGDDRVLNHSLPKKIGLDIDEVLCDWVNPWCDKFGLCKPTSWTFHRNIKDKFDEMRQSGELEEFYTNLPALIKPEDIPFEPFCYVTSRPVTTELTEKWLDKHGFPAAPVITVPVGTTKVEVLKESGIDIFVDDRFENFQELNNAGICTYLMDAPHNQRYQVGHKRIYSLKDLVK